MPQNQQFYETFIKLEFSNIFGSQMPDTLTHWHIDWDMVVNICSRNSKRMVMKNIMEENKYMKQQKYELSRSMTYRRETIFSSHYSRTFVSIFDE